MPPRLRNAMFRAMAPAWISMAAIAISGALNAPMALVYTFMAFGLISCGIAAVVAWVVLRRMNAEERAETRARVYGRNR